MITFNSVDEFIEHMKKQERNDMVTICKLREENLTQILTLEHRQHGLTLCETEDLVLLKRDGVTLARFSAVAATIQSILEEADNWLPGRDAIAALVACKGVEFDN